MHHALPIYLCQQHFLICIPLDHQHACLKYSKETSAAEELLVPSSQCQHLQLMANLPSVHHCHLCLCCQQCTIAMGMLSQGMSMCLTHKALWLIFMTCVCTESLQQFQDSEDGFSLSVPAGLSILAWYSLDLYHATFSSCSTKDCAVIVQK